MHKSVVLMMPDYRKDNPYQTLLAETLKAHGVEVVFPQGYRRVFPIFRAIRSSNVSVLHLHWLSPYLKGNFFVIKLVYCLKFLTDILLVKLCGKKIVWTAHNHVSHDAVHASLEEWTQRGLIGLADRVIFHDTSARDCFSKKYPGVEKKSVVIPHGHYRTVYGEAVDSLVARKALGLPEEGFIFLNLGMLKPYKGVEDLIRAWKERPRELAGHCLLIAGKPFEKEYEQLLVRQISQTQGVIFHPWIVEDSQMHLYMSCADVVVFPFRKILTSGSLILAMSYDKPVIAPRIGAIPETLGEADDLTYLPEDGRGLIETLKKSVRTDLSALSAKVRKACDRLDWDVVGKQTKKAYGYA